MATAKRLKIDQRYESAACAWCGEALLLGEDAAVCEACETPHHARCWDREHGCGAPHCVNRPEQPPPTHKQRKLAPGESFCQGCGDIISGFCVRCSQRSAPNWAHTGVKQRAPEAEEALKYAIVGLLCCSPLGIVAFMKGTQAKRIIAASPGLEGEGMATAAQVLGAIEMILLLCSLLRLISQH